jgi:integrase
MNPFSLDDLSKVFAAVRKRSEGPPEYEPMGTITALAASTGLRQGEFMGLRW